MYKIVSTLSPVLASLTPCPLYSPASLSVPCTRQPDSLSPVLASLTLCPLYSPVTRSAFLLTLVYRLVLRLCPSVILSFILLIMRLFYFKLISLYIGITVYIVLHPMDSFHFDLLKQYRWKGPIHCNIRERDHFKDICSVKMWLNAFA